MNDIRRYITILENASQDELQKYRDEVAYWKNERKKYWPVSPELMAQYKDGSYSRKNEYGLWWYRNGKRHRDGDKPAWIGRDGKLGWWQNDQYHRDGDKPAYIKEDGTLVWYRKSLSHRDGDKPAVIGADGQLSWRQNGKQHRFGGPAVIKPDGTPEWYWRGELIPVKSQEEFIEWMKNHK